MRELRSTDRALPSRTQLADVGSAVTPRATCPRDCVHGGEPGTLPTQKARRGQPFHPGDRPAADHALAAGREANPEVHRRPSPPTWPASPAWLHCPWRPRVLRAGWGQHTLGNSLRSYDSCDSPGPGT